MAAALPVLPYVGAVLTVAQVAQQGAAGKFNKAVADRNAQVQEQEAQQIQQQVQFDLQRADEDFQRAKGKTNVSFAMSGVDMSSSTAQRIMFNNAKQKELQDNIMQYNADIGSAKKMEQANYSRIQGTMAMQQARSAQISSIANYGSSLLSASKFS